MKKQRRKKIKEPQWGDVILIPFATENLSLFSWARCQPIKTLETAWWHFLSVTGVKWGETLFIPFLLIGFQVTHTTWGNKDKACVLPGCFLEVTDFQVVLAEPCLQARLGWLSCWLTKERKQVSWWEQRTAIISRGVSAGDMNRSGVLWNPCDWVFCFYSLVSTVSLSEH